MKNISNLLIIVGVLLTCFSCKSDSTKNPGNSESDIPLIRKDLETWFKFNGDLKDASKNHYQATNYEARWTTDRFGNEQSALEFSDINACIVLDEKIQEVFSESFSLSMWIQFKNDSRTILFGNDNSQNSVNIELHDNQNLALYWNDDEINIYSSHEVVFPHAWHHITFIRDKEHNMFKIGVDGKEVAREIGTGTDILPQGPFYIGKDKKEMKRVSSLKIDDLQISNKILPLKENDLVRSGQVFYIVNIAAAKTEMIAKRESEALNYEAYPSGYLWIPDYPSLSGAELYSVFFGPFTSQSECENAVEKIKEQYPNAYGLLVSQRMARLEINGVGNLKETKYKVDPDSELIIKQFDTEDCYMKSRIFLTLGKKQLFITEVFGYAEPGGILPLPEGSQYSCNSMYCGLGIFTSIVPTEEGIIIYRGYSDEPSAEYDGDPGPNWKKHKVILY